MNILVTGHSRGIGAALAEAHLGNGDRVFGIARSAGGSTHPRLAEVSCDFASPETIDAALDALVPSDARLDCVWLNAGVLGPIAAMHDTDLATLETVMTVNLWSNKVILDWLINRAAPPARVIAISSGASLSGNFGWGPYALSKAALNMLVRLYAHEMPHTQLLALAPGLVDTAMQDAIRGYSATDFPSLERLHAAAGTAAMPSPALAAQAMIAALPELASLDSGSFVDLRKR